MTSTFDNQIIADSWALIEVLIRKYFTLNIRFSHFLVKTVIFGWSLEFEIELFGHNPQIPQVCEFYDKYALFPPKKCPIFPAGMI